MQARSNDRFGGRSRVWLLAATVAVSLCAAALSASTASAAGTTLYAYVGGEATGTTPATCPADPNQTDLADDCTLTQALNDANGGDGGATVLLGTPSGDYVGNWTLYTTVTIKPASGVSGVELDGNSGSATGCETSSCDGPILSVDPSDDGLTAEIDNITLANADNTSGGGAVAAYGGANPDTLTFKYDTFSNDQAGTEGGAVDVLAGSGPGSATFTGDTFTDDSAQFGAAIAAGHGDGSLSAEQGTVTITDSTFSGNDAIYEGGALDSSDNGGSVATSVSDTTFVDNSTGADGGGGAIFSGGNESPGSGPTTTGSLAISNSTFYGNTAGITGGAIDASDNLGASDTSIWDSTFAANAVTGSSSPDDQAGTDISLNAGDASGSLWTAGDAFGDGCENASSDGSTWSDKGYNVGAGTCMDGGTADVTTGSLQLTTPANNGGSTETMLPSTTSPVVGVVPSGKSVTLDGASTQLCSRTDQRGFASAGSTCSAGAVEILSIGLNTASPLTAGTYNTAYSTALTASGPGGPYTFSHTGSVPAGLTLGSDGTLAGTPTSNGTSTFTVQATDSHGDIGTKSYSLTINPATPSAPSISNAPSSAYSGSSFAATVTDSDSTSGDDGALSVESLNTAVCTVTGTTVNFLAAGSCELQAQIAASSDGNYTAASGVEQVITITVAGAPTLKVSGVTNAGVYETAPKVKCQASDPEVSVGPCSVHTTSSHSATGLEITTVHYTATATNADGVSATVTGSYKVLGIYLAGVTYSKSSFVVKTGHTYKLVVNSSARPVYKGLGGSTAKFNADGHDRWSIKVKVDKALFGSHHTRKLQLKIGGSVHRVSITKA